MSGESFIKLTLILAFTGTKNQHVLSYNPEETGYRGYRTFWGYRTFRVGFNADGASVYRASLAFIFFEKIYKGGQNVLVKSLKTLANTGEIGFYFFIRT